MPEAGKPEDETSTGDGEQALCPACGGPTVPLNYGYPDGELFEAAERGEVALGGCVIFDDQPERECLRCSPGPPRGELPVLGPRRT